MMWLCVLASAGAPLVVAACVLIYWTLANDDRTIGEFVDAGPSWPLFLLVLLFTFGCSLASIEPRACDAAWGEATR